MPKGDGLGYVSRDHADLFRELRGELANKDPIELKPPYRVRKASEQDVNQRNDPVGVLVIKIRMPGERFSIEAVAKSEWMKWSIAEAITETFTKLFKMKIRQDAVLFCADEIEVLDVQMPYMGQQLWQFCELRFDYKVRLTSQIDAERAVAAAFAGMTDFEAFFCQALETKFREIYHLTVLGLINKRFALMDGRPMWDQLSLFKAAEKNDISTIARLLDNNVDPDGTQQMRSFPVNVLDEDDRFAIVTLSRTPLLAAAEEGNLEALRLLLNGKADISYQDKSGFHALYLAAGAPEGHKAVSFLLVSGAEVNITNKSGYTALHNACGCGEVNSIKALLEAKGDLNIRSTSGAAPIHVAVINDQVASLDTLRSCGANMDTPAFGGNTPVHEAVMQNNPDIIQALFDLKADVNIESGPDHSFATPLTMATQRKKKKAAKKLKELGAIAKLPEHTSSSEGEYEALGDGEYRMRLRSQQPIRVS